MKRKFPRIVLLIFSLSIWSSFSFAEQSHHSKTGTPQTLNDYVEQVSELSSRARANVYFQNPQSIFNGVQVSFVNVGTGNLTFLRRDMVASGRIPLVFARVYDSSGKGSIDFGPGWSLSAAESIIVADGKAHLLSENGSTIDFAKVDQMGFGLQRDYPSDYLGLRFVDRKTLEAKLRTGFTKRFALIGDAFRLVTAKDRDGNQIRLIYTEGLLSRIENANHTLTIRRNQKGRIVSVHDDASRKVQFSYDSSGRLTKVIDLGGKAWTYSYTGDGRLKEARDPLQRLNFAAFFEESGQVRRLQLPSGIVHFNFDLAAHVTTVTDRKNLVSRFFQNEEGITVRVTNPLNEETAIGLDQSRNVDSLSRNGSIMERMEFDSQHRLIARHTIAETGVVDHLYSYDPATGLLTTIHSNDGQDQSFAYDDAGHLRSATLPDGTRKFEFSAAGDLIGISKGERNVTFSPDPDGLFASMKDADNAITKMRYKAGGELQEVTFSGKVKGTFEYQPSGLRTKLVLAGRGRAEYNYDPAGNLLESKVFEENGKQTDGQQLELDESYQLTRWALLDGTVTQFKYDPSGNLTQIKKGKSITSFEYDSINRLTGVATPDGAHFNYSYKPGERSLIEQHQHAALAVEDLRDTGLTFASSLQVSATRPVTGVMGPVRFSENLGTFQLSGSDGTEIIRPHERVEPALKKLFLFDSTKSATQLRTGFNIPFNTMFIPAEYASINCCPECYFDGDEWYCPPCFQPPPPKPDVTGISPSGTNINTGLLDPTGTVFVLPVRILGTFNDLAEDVIIAPPDIGATSANVITNSDGSMHADSIFSLDQSTTSGDHNVAVSDSGGTSLSTATFTVFCPTSVSIVGLTPLPLEAEFANGTRTGVGAVATMVVSPLVSIWNGAPIEETVTPLSNSCPITLGDPCSFQGQLSVGNFGTRDGITFPPLIDTFYDEHATRLSFSILPSGLGCQASCLQTYSSCGHAIGTFFVNKLYAGDTLQGTPVTRVTVLKF